MEPRGQKAARRSRLAGVRPEKLALPAGERDCPRDTEPPYSASRAGPSAPAHADQPSWPLRSRGMEAVIRDLYRVRCCRSYCDHQDFFGRGRWSWLRNLLPSDNVSPSTCTIELSLLCRLFNLTFFHRDICLIMEISPGNTPSTWPAITRGKLRQGRGRDTPTRRPCHNVTESSRPKTKTFIENKGRKNKRRGKQKQKLVVEIPHATQLRDVRLRLELRQKRLSPHFRRVSTLGFFFSVF